MTSVHHLLDVNALVAWGWTDHADHDRTVRWIAAGKKSRGAKFFTSPIPEIGFVRVSVQRSAARVSVEQAAAVLRGMLKSLGSTYQFLPDDFSGTEWPEWCAGAARTTDAHLLLLAQRHGLQLATLDAGIAGAMLLPMGSKVRRTLLVP